MCQKKKEKKMSGILHNLQVNMQRISLSKLQYHQVICECKWLSILNLLPSRVAHILRYRIVRVLSNLFVTSQQLLRLIYEYKRLKHIFNAFNVLVMRMMQK